MAVMSRGKADRPVKVVKPKKRKTSTPHTKNHRFQPFSERIAKLKIDPIRRKRNDVIPERTAEETATYLGRALEEWKDLNLSQTFTHFAKDVSPLCDNLAMVLHNEESIMGLFMVYLEKKDALAMEPLLNLLSHFAHDLDVRFERHFSRTVATVSALAAEHQDPAVIEWSFTCLTWLFKYLSRLLVPDLRPLYDLMAPHLGKVTQKPFIIRFAAESLSFLVRKAAVVYDHKHSPLDLMVDHILQDWEVTRFTRSAELYGQGLMTLLTESIKGVQTQIHSSGLAVLKSLLKGATRSSEPATELLTGVLTSVIHHTNSTTFGPVADVVLEFITSEMPTASSSKLDSFSHMLLIVTSVRKGTRVTDWKLVIHALRALVEMQSDTATINDSFRSTLLGGLAQSMQTAPLDAVLPNLTVLDTVQKGSWRPYFLRFCDLFSRLGSERFQQFLLGSLQKFLLQSSTDDNLEILILVINLQRRGLKTQLNIPSALSRWILQRVQVNETSSSSEFACANLVLKAVSCLHLDEPTITSLSSVLGSLFRHSNMADVPLMYRDFAFGRALQWLLQHQSENVFGASDLEHLLRNGHSMLNSPLLWSNVKTLLRTYGENLLNDTTLAMLQQDLTARLSLPSHELREMCLETLQTIYECRGLAVPEMLNTAIQIETTPIGLDSSRVISMNIRRLGASYCNEERDPWMSQAVPTYCLGLLHLQLSQAWDDATEALSKIVKVEDAERVTVAILQQWLQGPEAFPAQEDVAQDPVLDQNSDNFAIVSDFECSNLARVMAICRQVFHAENSGYASAKQLFNTDHKHCQRNAAHCRTQALRVLNKMPSIAEKYNRFLVPILLEWTRKAEASETSAVQQWSRQDQKALLALFANFSNPKVLFKAAEVYDLLVQLCGNGDTQLQQSALKALFAWKVHAINRYEERLLNLLDDARFREELSVFLQSEDEAESLRSQDEDQLMPILLRLLYGRAIGGSKSGGHVRRTAIFVALSRYGSGVLRMFVDIALAGANEESNSLNSESELNPSVTTLKQQVGLLNMLSDMLQTLGPELEPQAGRILDAVIRYTVQCSGMLSTHRRLEPSAADAAPGSHLDNGSLVRSLRQSGLQCLVDIYSIMNGAELEKQAETIVQQLFTPRLEKFAAENMQSVSASLKLLSAWSCTARTATFLTKFNDSIIDRVAELLAAASTKEQVRLFILRDILGNLLKSEVDHTMLEPYVSTLLSSISELLNTASPKDVLDACVSIVSKLAALVTDQQEAQQTISLCAALLRKPGKVVSPSTKMGLLNTVLPLISLVDAADQTELYDTNAALFSRLHGGESRTFLSKVQTLLSKGSPDLQKSARICEDLNATGARIDGPDHDRRAQGFDAVYKEYETFTLPQWTPIIHNCLYYLCDADDMVNRQSASKALEYFFRAAKDNRSVLLLTAVVFAALQRGMQAPSELVRVEHLNCIHHLVEQLPNWPAVADMVPLIVGGDQEASFFTNILHIQQHRRLRALRRLSEDAATLSSGLVSNLFLPLLEHFIFDGAGGDAARTLADQTIQTLGHLARSLTWSSYRAVIKRYLASMKLEEHEKAMIRLLGVLSDALLASTSRAVETAAEKHPIIESGESEAISASPQSKATNLANSLPKDDIIITEVTERILPLLLDYIHHKDESTVDRRVPLAVTVVKLLKSLPDEANFALRVAPALSDLCQILRSRSQEARDQTRRTLSIIAKLIGPSYFGFLVKEMRSSLQRGYQLHVLSFTLHSLLVDCGFSPGTLDHCINELVAIVMDDVFGVTGEEKDAEEYKSGMKEIKASKSFDTMELLAKTTSVTKVMELIRPIKALLTETLDANAIKKIDDLLGRVRKGLDLNPTANNRELLVLCYQICRHSRASEAKMSSTPEVSDVVRRREATYLLAPERKATGRKAAGTIYNFKLASFSLSLARKIVRRHEELMSPANVAGFLPVAGDALVDGHVEVKIAAMKFLTAVMRVPLPGMESNSALYAREAVTVIQGAPNTLTDAARAALDLLTAILRDRRSAEIRDRDLAHVLKILKIDIDEPDRQGIVYRFLRSVLGRKVNVPEVYEIMDEVSKAMVTNPDQQVRESARSAFSQFVLDYPQAKKRWQKQINFLIQNLDYEHKSGRQSVMEMLHQLLVKLGDDVIEPLVLPLFIPLVLRMVNDSDTSCRDMAGILIGKLFERAGSESTTQMLSAMNKWLADDGKQVTLLAALQAWKLYISQGRSTKKEAEVVAAALATILAKQLGTTVSSNSRLAISTLDTLTAMCEAVPSAAFSTKSEDLWVLVQQSLLCEDPNIRERAAILVGSLNDDFASTSSKKAQGLATVPLQGSHGLLLAAHDMQRAAKTGLKALRDSADDVSDTFLAQTARNLTFLGRCFVANNMLWRGEGQFHAEHETNSASEDERDDQKPELTAFQYLLSRLSRIIRRDMTGIRCRMAALQCQTALVNVSISASDLNLIMQPLYVLTDASISQPLGAAHKEMSDKAHELLDLVQEKVGTEVYVAALAEARNAVKGRRDERRQKRKMEAVSAPEKWAKDKKRRHEREKVRQKAKNAEARGRRRGW